MTSRQGISCIGIDIGGTNLRFALVDQDGTILASERGATDIHLGKEHFLVRLSSGIAAMHEKAKSLGRDVRVVGMGVPGLIAADGFVHSSVNLQPIVGLNLRELVARNVHFPVVSANDANAAALGEKIWGAGRMFDSLLLLTLGTGVGSGLILGGRLWTGADGVAAEYGHATVEPDGISCSCGNRGCLEQYASATALVAAAGKALDGGEGSVLARLGHEGLSAATIAAAAESGDPLAISLFARAGRYLGIAGATIANLLNLEAIILAGGMAGSFDLLAGPMRTEIESRAFAVPASRITVLKGELGDDAGILGAAALAWTYLDGDGEHRSGTAGPGSGTALE
jgi:glucokinase